MIAYLALLVALASPAPAAANANHAIVIVINGERLPMQPPPVFRDGMLLVPVRRTIEALGLPFEVQGKRILTQVGSKSVALTLGSRRAEIDGQTVEMGGPAIEIQDVLYVPLRFFTGVLGAQASFDKRTNTVNVVAQLVGRTGDGLSASGSGYSRTGTVAAVDVLSNPPTITLGYPTGPKTIPIGPNAAIEMHDVDANVTTPGELVDVRPGDFARVDMRKDGRVERVTDAFGSRNGRIVAVVGNQFVMDDGQVVAAGRTTEVSLDGKAASFAQLQAGDVVTVRYNVETNEVREVLAGRTLPAASPGPQTGPHIASVAVEPDRALRAGESWRITLTGTPGAAATFDLGSYVTDLAMHESPAGTYSATYTVPAGANFADVPVVGHLSAGGAATDASSAHGVWASGSPPGVTDFAPDNAATVNTSRPAIYVTFASEAVPVNPSSILLWVDGRDVTASCVRSSQFISYLPSYSYPDGPVRVTVRVSDRAGNTTTKSWTFTIRTR